MDRSRVAPELRGRLRWLPPIPFGSALARRIVNGLLARTPSAKVEGVRVEVVRSGTARLRLYLPDVRTSPGALLWIHGGGYLIGRAVQDDRHCAETARSLGIVVASAEHRLAPEHPFPTPLDDCHAALLWLRAEAERLGIDPRRIAIGGQSAGGGLAAALVQRAQDEGIGAAAQWLFCPMLDDRTAALRELDPIRHFVWDNAKNRLGWRLYLGREPGAPQLPDYAAPARRDDLAGLPPAWIYASDIELFHAEDEIYAERLRAAAVPGNLRDGHRRAPTASNPGRRDRAWRWRCLDRRAIGLARRWPLQGTASRRMTVPAIYDTPRCIHQAHRYCFGCFRRGRPGRRVRARAVPARPPPRIR